MPRLCRFIVTSLVMMVFLTGCRETVSTNVETVAPPPSPATEPPNVSGAVTAEIADACIYIDRCFKRLEAEPESELPSLRVASIIQSAERTLPIFWGLDLAKVPPELKQRIDAYPEAIGKWVDRVNETKSKQALEEIQKVADAHYTWRDQNQDQKWQAYIEQDEKVIKEIQQAMARIQSAKEQKLAEIVLLEHLKLLNLHRTKQATAYQKQAIKHCHQFVDYCNTNTIISDETLFTEFAKAEIEKIDPTILGYHARRMYDIAVGMMESKLGYKNKAKFMLDLAEAARWPLSDL
ncbi:hypothetical protein [Tuwongella immobilis]|uniref:Uncharacterized protein n=1 Tax=Tuwongella immobilis TaxID=692036 RepID=A0A6C2YGJ9_9BACT|nr:hypothetical protein [Tuwongella immobilis]VIP00616.1 Uncharacterized protein OS=Isosphaera pallida (strain ATCC 43644 / DSM 9630 / IS1B) GN=Isop_2203 PE=4 SV=1 [Tuwongella immobilis]VTR96650.1 Uncharacterized protein OS=Isosphaera pallida (strain ATCC 43644 / DSM 9630 / IS1B) GN=Isop_2203 PE=4 SV=1 [Tuwongella immobilis]